MSAVKEIIRFSRIAFEHKLVYGASGNLSFREKNTVYITKSGGYLGFLREKDIIKFKINIKPPKDASMETKMHLNCYKADASVKSVFHSQPLYSTLCSASKINPDLKFVPETMFYIKKIGYADYNHPGSKELAAFVGEKARSCDIIILKNHGLVALGKDINEVILKTIAFDFLCGAVFISESAGVNINYLSSKTFSDFKKYIQKLKKV